MDIDNAILIDVDALRELMMYHTRVVLVNKCLVQQDYWFPRRVVGSDLMLVGVQKRLAATGSVMLVARGEDVRAVEAERLAQAEGGRNDDGTGGDMGVCLGGGKVDDFLPGGPGADGDNHVFVDGVGVPFDIFDGDELCVHRSEMITDGGRKGD